MCYIGPNLNCTVGTILIKIMQRSRWEISIKYTYPLLGESLLNLDCIELVISWSIQVFHFMCCKGVFLAVTCANRWPCHWLTESATFCFLTLKSDPRDQWPLRHLITVMRKHDLTNILTILTIFDNIDNFDHFWQFLTTFDNLDNFDNFDNFW